jgi:hypothetical protein
MTENTAPTETRKAPRWAQDEISYLKRRLAEAQDRIAVLSEGPADSSVLVPGAGYPDRLLGRDPVIRFLLDGGYIEVQHDRENREYLIVRSCGDTQKTSGLAIQPSVSNAVRVRLAESR